MVEIMRWLQVSPFRQVAMCKLAMDHLSVQAKLRDCRISWMLHALQMLGGLLQFTYSNHNTCSAAECMVVCTFVSCCLAIYIFIDKLLATRGAGDVNDERSPRDQQKFNSCKTLI